MKTIEPRIIWIGESLGYRGGRRTGLPLIDDFTLPSFSEKLGIRELLSPCTNQIKEMTASQVWAMLSRLSVNKVPFLWNIFPFHPYNEKKPLSNRQLKSSELEQTEDITDQLLNTFQFSQILALGKKSFNRLKQLGFDPIYIRHPSHGGSTIFRQQINEIYSTQS
ncbi:MAG: uracil-DNA glycosylase [Candidatus Kariarchaeaceae archaeon]|jgi:uracil-DNA glycosylase